MTKTKWIAIPALTAALVLSGAAQGGSIKANDVAAASDFSSKGGKGHAKGQGHFKHANKHHWRGAYAYKSRGANSPYFCPPGQAKKPGLGSAHMC
jgi:hypothetical protein